MSNFSKLNRLVCEPPKPLKTTKECPAEKEVPKEIWYDAEKRRYYVYQREALGDKFLPSSLYSKTTEDLILPFMKTEGRDRIIEYFNIQVNPEDLESIEVNLEKTRVYDKMLKPVRFTLYINEDEFSFGKNSRFLEKQYEIIVINGKTFFFLLEELLKKLNLYSKYQSILYSFDKIKILKQNDQPFYLSLIASRLKEFTKSFEELLQKNNSNLQNLGDIVIGIETQGYIKKIVDIYIDNSRLKCQNNELSIGLEEFLKSAFLLDEDLVSFILNIEEFLSDNKVSWVDLIIRFGVQLKILNFSFTSNLSASPCFPDFNPNFDSILEGGMSFFEKLEYSSHKRNSLSLMDVLKVPRIMLPNTQTPFSSFDSLLDPVFKSARDFTAEIENLDFDNPFNMFLDSFSDFSFEGPDFDKIYQFLGPEALGALLNKLLSNFQKMSNPLEIAQNAISNFLKKIDAKGMRKLILKLPANLRIEYIEKLLQEFKHDIIKFIGYEGFIELMKEIPTIHRLNYLDVLKNLFQIPEDLMDLNVDYPEILKRYDFIIMKNVFKRLFSNIPQLSWDLDDEEAGDRMFPSVVDNGILIVELKQILDIIQEFTEEEKSYFFNLVQETYGIDKDLASMNEADLTLLLNNHPFSTTKRIFMSMFVQDSKVKSTEDPTYNTLNLLDFLKKIQKKIKTLPSYIQQDQLIFLNIDTEDFLKYFEELTLPLDSEKIAKSFENFLKQFPEIDLFSDLPEFNKMAQVFDVLSVPGRDIMNPLEFLDNLGQDISIFSEKFLKIPNIPPFPPIKFSIVQLIQEILYFAIKKAVTAIAAIIIEKIVGFIKNFSVNGLSNGIPVNKKPDFNPTNGLQDFVEAFICKETQDTPDDTISMENKDPIEATDTMLKFIIPSIEISDESYVKLAQTIGSSSNVIDIINAVTGDDEVSKENFLNDLTEIIRANHPEFRGHFKDKNSTKNMFDAMNNFVSPETLRDAKAYVNLFNPTDNPDTEPEYCITKQEVQDWRDFKQEGLQESGYTGDASQKAVDDQQEEINNNATDLVDMMNYGFMDSLFDSIEDILKGDPECVSPTKASKEIVSEQKQKEKEASDIIFEKINLVFTQDLLEDSSQSVFNGKGILSRIMSDKYGRSLSLINSFKNNFFTSLLMRLGIIPPPVYPTTIGKKVTEKLNETLNYIPATDRVEVKPSEIKSLSSFFRNIVFSEEAEEYKAPDVIFHSPQDDGGNKLGVDIKYIDYDIDRIRYFINIGDELVVDSRLKIPQEIVSSYPTITNLAKSQFIGLLLRKPYTTWVNDNKVIFGDDFKNNFSLNQEIQFGYPTEVTRGNLDILYQTFIEQRESQSSQEFDANSVKNEDIPHIGVLDPETYGTNLGIPKLYANPEEIPSGYFKSSKGFYDKKTEDKLQKTILNLHTIKQFVDNYKKILEKNDPPKSMFLQTSPECLIEKPLDKIIPIEKLSMAQGMVKTYIRTFLSEYIILAYNIFKNNRLNFDEGAFADYIYKKMKQEVRESMKPGKDIYNSYVVHIMMLMCNGEAYINLHNDNISNRLFQVNEEYQPLQTKQIEFLKNYQITSLDKEYQNYISGYYGISFREKWKQIYDASQILTLKSDGMTSNDIKFADKLGSALNNLDLLEEAMIKTIENEIKEYQQIYKSKYRSEKNIYNEFLKALTGEEESFSLNTQLENGVWQTKSYYTIKEKDMAPREIEKSGLISILQALSTEDKNKYISQVYGDAKKINAIYINTIGISYTLAIYYKQEKISSFTEDVPDVIIKDLLDDLNNFSNIDSELIDHRCYIDNLFKTKESIIIFDLAFQVKKYPTILSIYYMENLMASITAHEDEKESDFFNDVLGAVDVFSSSFGRTTKLLSTKNEIKAVFLSNYVREFFDPPIDKESNFLDFKIKETISNTIDFKNLSLGGPSGEAPSFFQETSFVKDVELDENGFPVVNKFLKNFK